MAENRGATEVALERIEDEVHEIKRAFKGDEFSEQAGVLGRLKHVEDDVKVIKEERAAEKSERMGQTKLLRIVGATSIFGVLTTFAVLITLIINLQGG